ERRSADAPGRALAGVVACVLIAAATATAGVETPSALGPSGPIARRHEHIEVRIVELRQLARTSIGRVGVVALRDGAGGAVAFQVDERQGRQIAMANGKEPSRDEKPGVLDPDDLVVFMPCDVGTRASVAQLSAAVAGLETWREIQIDDPIDGARGFAYVVVAEHPPMSGRRYVAYEATDDRVATAPYRIGMTHALPSYFAIAMGGPLGPNLLDGLRLRAEAKLLANLATLRLTEQDARNELIAWTAGPVRVVRRSRHDVDLLGIGLHISA